MRKLVIAPACALLLATGAARAATINVYPGDSYGKIEAANPGDTVLIHPGTYKFRVHLKKAGTASAPITIRAADPAKPPVWDLSGTLVENAPGSYNGGDKGRGCWQITGSHYRISSLVFRGCRNGSKNSGGIRTNGSKNVTIRNVTFRHNDNGFTGHGENTVLEHCEFDANGNVNASSSAPTHNIYVYGGTLAVRYSYLHDPTQGQNFHIRARESVFEYNWIARAKSYEGDLMTSDFDSTTQQKMVFRGNVVVGNAQPKNGYQVIALFNDKSSKSGVKLHLDALWNTFVIKATSNPRVVHLLNGSMSAASANISNNIIVGTTRPYALSDAGRQNYTVTGVRNWLGTGSSVGSLTGTVFGQSPGFKSSTDFTLATGSACIGKANGSVSGKPLAEYYKDETLTKRYRKRLAALDIGAFESTTGGSVVGPYYYAHDGVFDDDDFDSDSDLGEEESAAGSEDALALDALATEPEGDGAPSESASESPSVSAGLDAESSGDLGLDAGGCSTSGPATGGSGLAVLGALAFLAGRRRRRAREQR